jgi:hypothetical protein
LDLARRSSGALWLLCGYTSSRVGVTDTKEEAAPQRLEAPGLRRSAAERLALEDLPRRDQAEAEPGAGARVADRELAKPVADVSREQVVVI